MHNLPKAFCFSAVCRALAFFSMTPTPWAQAESKADFSLLSRDQKIDISPLLELEGKDLAQSIALIRSKGVKVIYIDLKSDGKVHGDLSFINRDTPTKVIENYRDHIQKESKAENNLFHRDLSIGGEFYPSGAGGWKEGDDRPWADGDVLVVTETARLLIVQHEFIHFLISSQSKKIKVNGKEVEAVAEDCKKANQSEEKINTVVETMKADLKEGKKIQAEVDKMFEDFHGLVIDNASIELTARFESAFEETEDMRIHLENATALKLTDADKKALLTYYLLELDEFRQGILRANDDPNLHEILQNQDSLSTENAKKLKSFLELFKKLRTAAIKSGQWYNKQRPESYGLASFDDPSK